MQLEVTSRAVLELTAPSLVLPRETTTLEDLVSHHLLGGGEVESRERWEENLVKAVEDELRERHLQILPQVTNKASTISENIYTVLDIRSSGSAVAPESGAASLYHSPGPQKVWNYNLLHNSCLCIRPHGQSTHWHLCHKPSSLLLGAGELGVHVLNYW